MVHRGYFVRGGVSDRSKVMFSGVINLLCVIFRSRVTLYGMSQPRFRNSRAICKTSTLPNESNFFIRSLWL